MPSLANVLQFPSAPTESAASVESPSQTIHAKPRKKAERPFPSTYEAPDSVKCLKDVSAIPGKYFLNTEEDGSPCKKANGSISSKGATLRKLVLLTIADFAKKDGTNAWMSLPTLLERLPCSRRQLIDTITWLIDADFLEKQYKSKHGTNTYTVKPHSAVMGALSSDTTQCTKHQTQCTNEETQCTKHQTQCGHECTQTSERFNKTNIYNEEAAQIPQTSSQDSSKQNNGPKQVHRQKRNFKSEANILASELYTLSNGDARFETRYKNKFADLMSREYSKQEITADFSRFYAKLDKASAYEMSSLTRIFCDTAEDSMNAVRGENAKRERDATAVKRRAAEMQAEAERERIERAKAREKELEMMEEELPD